MLDAKHFRRIDEILQTALALDPAERPAFISEACSGDDSLIKEVECLLSSDEEQWDLIGSPAFEMVAPLLAREDRPELDAGDSIAQYRIVSLLGVGGMGQVYLAEDTRLGRKVALKLLPKSYTQDESRLRRFQQEARAASALNHPNILTIFDTLQFETRHFIVTEYIEGESLRQRLKQTRLSADESLNIFIQVATALAAAHEAGIIHRDIKPENIMLRRDSLIKVLDFGLAKLTEQHDVPRADAAVADMAKSSGLVLGTVKYMSPEQAQGLPVDQRSDVFSLGVVLYEMVAGRTPFEGENARELVKSILTDEPTGLKDLFPEVPNELQHVVSKCLSKEKTPRYQSAVELLSDLKAFQETLRLNAASVTSTPSAAYIVNGIRRHKVGAAFVLAALVIVGLGTTLGLRRILRGMKTLSGDMKVSRITDTEKSYAAAVSPDGKFIAQARKDAGKDNIWLTNVDTKSNTQLASGGGNDLTFSRDGERLYFNRNGTVFELGLAGGEPRRVLSEVSGPIGLSPRGDRLAFVRKVADNSILLIANLDGSGEEELTRRKKPDYISAGPAWSPDGALIAYGINADASNNQGGLAAFDLSTRQSRAITNHRWRSMERLAWLSDGSGLVMPASADVGAFSLWFVPYPTGEPQMITKDLNLYTESTVTDAGDIVAIHYENRNTLWTVPVGNPTAARPLNTNRHDLFRAIACMPDGRILYPSNSSGNRDIWVMNADGTNPRQLTSNTGGNLQPDSSPDGQYILFSSNRDNSNTYNIWRMNSDGSNPLQLTHVKGAVQGTTGPDGKWVFFAMGGPETDADTKTIWKVPIDGGEPVQITTTPATGPSISSDGTTIACWYKEDKDSEWAIALIPISGGPPIKILPANRTGTFRPQWTPDGQAVSYVSTRNGVSNIWLQPINGEAARQFTQFTSEQIESFDWAPNGDLICARSSSVHDVVRISNFR
jgi:Tol biopolymer transport system component/tRNA A-37 threonylcarbamoyl transferase component Bud32